MTPAQKLLIRKSWAQVVPIADQAATLFYQRLFEIDPSVRALFRDTENTRRFVKVIEDMVRRYPEQFLWTHRRYRTRPRGMAPLYPPKRS